MPAPNRPTPRKGAKFLGAKTMIATLSLAIVLGLWNVFSAGAMRADLAPADPTTTPPPDSPGLAPLPTLVPLVDVSGSLASAPAQGALAQDPAGQTTDASAPLRSVTAPQSGGTVIVQKFKPSIASFDSGGNGGGGGGGGKSRGVTRSRSSRPK